MAGEPHLRVTVEEAEARFDELLALVEEGKTVGLVGGGKLRALLVPITDDQRSLPKDANSLLS